MRIEREWEQIWSNGGKKKGGGGGGGNPAFEREAKAVGIVVIVEVGGAFIKKMPSHYSTSHINNTTNKMTNTTYF